MEEQALTYDDVMDRLYILPRADRIFAYVDELQNQVAMRDHWRCVAAIWTDTEFPYDAEEQWRELWEDAHRWDGHPGRGFHPTDPEIGGMSEEERAIYAGLPETVEVYRGFQGEDWHGFAWTLDRERAEWFARRFAVLAGCGAPRVACGRVPRTAILLYLDSRNEQEVVVRPEDVEDVTVSEAAVPAG